MFLCSAFSLWRVDEVAEVVCASASPKPCSMLRSLAKKCNKIIEMVDT